MMNTFGKFKFGLAVLALTSALIFRATPVFAAGNIQGGNFYMVSNTQNPAWADSVGANVGDIVQFKSDVNNVGSEALRNICVKADLPKNVSGNSITSTFHIKADNATEVVDTATVTFADNGRSKNLDYFGGHAFLIRHPGYQQSSFEQIGDGGWHCVGDLEAGNQFFLEVLLKASLTENVPSPSPSPSPSPTPSPSPSPVVSPSPSVAPNLIVQCADGSLITVLAGQNANLLCQQQQQSQTQNNNQSVNVGGTTVNLTNSQTAANPASPAVIGASTSAVSELPKTGLPLAGLALTGLAPIGLKLRRFTRKDEEGLTPSFIWQEREFKKG